MIRVIFPAAGVASIRLAAVDHLAVKVELSASVQWRPKRIFTAASAHEKLMTSDRVIISEAMRRMTSGA